MSSPLLRADGFRRRVAVSPGVVRVSYARTAVSRNVLTGFISLYLPSCTCQGVCVCREGTRGRLTEKPQAQRECLASLVQTRGFKPRACQCKGIGRRARVMASSPTTLRCCALPLHAAGTTRRMARQFTAFPTAIHAATPATRPCPTLP